MYSEISAKITPWLLVQNPGDSPVAPKESADCQTLRSVSEEGEMETAILTVSINSEMYLSLDSANPLQEIYLKDMLIHKVKYIFLYIFCNNAAVEFLTTANNQKPPNVSFERNS